MHPKNHRAEVSEAPPQELLRLCPPSLPKALLSGQTYTCAREQLEEGTANQSAASRQCTALSQGSGRGAAGWLALCGELRVSHSTCGVDIALHHLTLPLS